MNVLEESITALWELESVLNPAHEDSVSYKPTVLKFQEEIKMFDDGKEVLLPWKQVILDKLFDK